MTRSVVSLLGLALLIACAACGTPPAAQHPAAQFVDDPETAGDLLKELARPGDAILFKGSRGTHVEKALERYLA